MAVPRHRQCARPGGGGGAAGLDMLQFIASNCEVDCMDFSK